MAEGLSFPVTTLWLDPGESVGWAAWVTWTQPGTRRVRAQPGRFLSGQGPRHVVLDDFQRFVTRFTSVTVGWEDYVQLPGQVGDSSALRVIGVLEWLTHVHHLDTLPPQVSSSRGLGALHLKTLGWQAPGLRDANAAAAHLLTHLFTARRLPSELLAQITDTLDEEPDGER